MLGFSSKKVPASDGLLDVGVSSCLTALDILGPNPDGIALATVPVGYIKSHSLLWNASLESMDRYAEAVWAGLCLNRPKISSLFAIFAIDSVTAAEFFEVNGLGEISGIYESLGLNGRSKCDDARFCELAHQLCQAAIALANRKCEAWRPS